MGKDRIAQLNPCLAQVSTWEEEKNQLEAQLSEASSKCEELAADNSRLGEQVDMVVWKEEKEQLTVALEEEKDKVFNAFMEVEYLLFSMHTKWHWSEHLVMKCSNSSAPMCC